MPYTVNLRTSVVKPERKKIDLLPILLYYKQKLSTLFQEKPTSHIRINLLWYAEGQPRKKRKDFEKHLKLQRQRTPGFFFWLFFTRIAERLEALKEKNTELLSVLQASDSEISRMGSEISKLDSEFHEQKWKVMNLETELNTLEEDKKKIAEIKKENEELREYYYALDNRIKDSIEYIQKKTPKFSYDFHHFTLHLTNIIWHIALKHDVRINLLQISRFFRLYHYYAMLKHQTFLLDSKEDQINRIGIILDTCLRNQGLKVPSCTGLLPLYCTKTNKPMPILKVETDLESMKKTRKQLHKKYPIFDDPQRIKTETPPDLLDLTHKDASYWEYRKKINGD